jgi:DNA-directed RNA polymerase specialized sigma24 family protein
VGYLDKLVEVIRHIREGDESAYAKYLGLRGNSLSRLGRRFLGGDRDRLQDAKQEILFRLWKYAHRMDLEVPKKLYSYLALIERAAVIDIAREAAYMRMRYGDGTLVDVEVLPDWELHLLAGEASPIDEERLDWEKLASCVPEVLDKLCRRFPRGEQAASEWRRHYLGGEGYVEIAKTDGTVMNTVKLRSWRFNNRIVEELNDQYEELIS